MGTWSKWNIQNPVLRRMFDRIFSGQDEIEGLKVSGGISIGEVTPVDAVAATVVLAAADFAVVNNDDEIEFDGKYYTKVASGANAEELEFTNAAGLAALINGLDAWGATETGGAVTITAATKGISGNGYPAMFSIKEATTADGAEAVKATATIEGATLARLATGDYVTFADRHFTKVASDPVVAAGEFEDTAGLIALIDALDDWGAELSTADITITAAENGEEFNDFDVFVILLRTTDSGVNGTPADKGTIVWDDDYIYVSTDESTISVSNWKK